MNQFNANGACKSSWAVRVGRSTRQWLGYIAPPKRSSLVSRIRELEEENARLSRLAITDDLTGAYNRRYFDQRIRHESVSSLGGHSLAFCLFDVDHFKAYNDALGHVAGDDALRRIARVATSQLRREQDVLCRLGGDEFCMMLCLDSPAAALAIVERVQRKVRELALSHAGDGALTISVGAVWLTPRSVGALSPKKLYLEADRMLYKAKRNGRDRVELIVL